eukprot:GFYU01008733.1.p1 GENE.GFYU01008733.1~~GFYU01008733.1.p1  ORF type:complete len:274 (-),score=86.50 GFYU01008733.1:260-1081(-)
MPEKITWREKIAKFAGFSSLFFAAASGFFLSVLQLSTEEPWLMDRYANAALLGLPDGTRKSFHAWFAAFGDEAEHVTTIVQMVYKFSVACVLLACVLVLLILFLQSSNRLLILLTQFFVCAWLALLNYWLYQYIEVEGSTHFNLAAFLLAANFVGFWMVLAWGRRPGYNKQKVKKLVQKNRDIVEETLGDDVVRPRGSSGGSLGGSEGTVPSSPLRERSKNTTKTKSSAKSKSKATVRDETAGDVNMNTAGVTTEKNKEKKKKAANSKSKKNK